MRILPRTAPAIILTSGALVVALSTGGAVAATMITGAQIKDGTVTTADIKNQTLKKKDLSPTTVAALKGNTGVTPAEPWHQVGAPGQPAFQTFQFDSSGTLTWSNETFGGVHETAGFYRDPYGGVHLKGTVCARYGSGCYDIGGSTKSEVTIFTLPAGYRPAHKVVFSVMSAKGAIRVDVRASGEVVTDINVAPWMALDGITLRCAQSGANGCP